MSSGMTEILRATPTAIRSVFVGAMTPTGGALSTMCCATRPTAVSTVRVGSCQWNFVFITQTDVLEACLRFWVDLCRYLTNRCSEQSPDLSISYPLLPALLPTYFLVAGGGSNSTQLPKNELLLVLARLLTVGEPSAGSLYGYCW